MYVNGLPIEVVPCAKILGLRISNDLKWNAHSGFNKTVLPLPIKTSKNPLKRFITPPAVGEAES